MTALRLTLEDLACPCCATGIEQAVAAMPGVTRARVDYRGRTLSVEGPAEEADVRRAVEAAGCRCSPDELAPLATLRHRAEALPVTGGSDVDRMQYELPHTEAAEDHHPGAAGHDPGSHGHGGHDHDMSDPGMAAAMERDMRRRFWVALVLTLPVVLLSPIASNTLGLDVLGSMTASNIAMFALSTPIVWWAGWIFIAGAWTSLRHRALNMAVLIAVGVLAAWWASVLLTLLDRETFFEAAAMLVTFVLFGHWMEMRSRRGTNDALKALFDIVPPTATVIRDGREEEVATADIVPGDLIRLRPGDRVPVDGEVTSGSGAIDESLVTGESIP
ncbi:MAG TPA: cation transporter, partial [Miltoncostaeaceae bacterium]|nr:cation transporter [Miltoncostaeaceae bacterium]